MNEEKKTFEVFTVVAYVNISAAQEEGRCGGAFVEQQLQSQGPIKCAHYSVWEGGVGEGRGPDSSMRRGSDR